MGVYNVLYTGVSLGEDKKISFLPCTAFKIVIILFRISPPRILIVFLMLGYGDV